MFKRILLLFLTSLFTTVLFSQKTNLGKEFWLSFYGRISQEQVNSNPEHYLDLYILVSSKNGCSGTVSNPNTGYSQSFSVAANTIEKVYIPYEQSYCTSVNDTVGIFQKGIYITTTDTVALYLGNQKANSFDASCVLPTSALGYSYKIASYIDDSTSTFIAVATEDNTQVEFSLNNGIDNENGVPTRYNDNVTYSKLLNKGETILLTGYNLLGSTIKSLNCKKLAVFSGNYCPYVPYINENSCCCCDVLVEQVPPINTWGKKYLVNSTMDRPTDSKVIIIPKEDNTLISIKSDNQNNTQLINQGDYIEADASYSGVLIEGDKPISVTQYAIGSNCSGFGDPFMLWINPAEQTLKESIFASCPTPRITNHYLQVKTKTDNISDIYLDESEISSYFKPFAQDTAYSFAVIEIDSTSHSLISNEGYMAYVYGYANNSSIKYESYGYTMGCSLYNLEDYYNVGNSSDSLNTIYFDTEEETNTYDVNDTVTISREIGSEFDSVIWVVNDSIYLQPNDTGQVSYSWQLPASDLNDGVNTISMLIVRSCMTDTISGNIWLRKAENNITASDTIICKGESVIISCTSSIKDAQYTWFTQTDTLAETGSSITVNPIDTTTYYVYSSYGNYNSQIDSITITIRKLYTVLYDSICKNETYDFNSEILNASGTYIDTLTTLEGCDSIITLHLYKGPKLINSSKSICSDEYTIFRGDTLIQTGIYSDTVSTATGCDSIFTLNLTVNQIDSIFLSATINEDEYYEFNGESYTESGSYWAYLLNMYNCDSIVNLELTVILDYDINVPQGFSPNGDGVNDYLVIDNLEKYPNNHIMILNRWGNKLFEAKPYLNDWDGTTKNGNRPPAGTYFYILELEKGKPAKKGWFWIEK